MAVPRHRTVRVPGAAVDIGPGGGVDDHLGPVTLEHRVDAGRRVEVELAPGPGDRSGRPGERSVGEGGDQRAAQAPGRAGHRDAHQLAGRSVAIDAAARPFARRDPYWRS